ncbi:MAG: methyltransferase domain-containing protein [Acidobacteria bacterium]|nr:methyltransferase domain-containing protein [Acidobacteriota bacterium]
MEKGYMQFGCGTTAPDGWLNFDAGPAFWIQSRFPFLKALLAKRGFPIYPGNISYGDVIKGLPVQPQSLEAVYSSHVLEHLSLEEFRITLRNVHRYLRPGGTFRMVLPDLEQLIQAYVKDGSHDAANRFMQESYLGEKSSPRGLRAIPTALFGRSKHLWMWDYKSIEAELAAAGFVAIRRAQLGDSPDPRFSEVESEGRWTGCLGVDCKRP